MSPEINGINGNPPSVIRRKKNREKKVTTKSFDLNAMSNNCHNYFPVSSTHLYSSIPDVSTYYSFINSSEPVSLPVYPPNYPHANINFMGSVKNLQVPQTQMNVGDTEYLSLPLVNNMMEQNEEDTGKRRFSDPGLPNESDSSTNSFDERVIQKLSQQVSSLKENNRRLTREVTELRIEVNQLKQQQSLRHYDRDYEPGMLADVIREVRDAARVREDALIARVKHLIEEKQLSLNHMHLVTEKNKNNDRISKLEEQLKKLSLSNHQIRSDTETAGNKSSSNNENGTSSARQVLELEREALELRRELQDTRAKKDEFHKIVVQLDEKLANVMRRHDISISDVSDDAKTASIESLTVSTVTTSPISHQQNTINTPRVTLSGPVTDL